MKLSEVANGWFEFVRATPERKQMINERLSICDTCPHKQQLSLTGQLIIQSINVNGSIFKCELCGCPLAAKTANRESSCPAGKWLAFIIPDTYY